MPTSVTRTFRFEAAHRLLNYSGKCRHLHGHSYSASVSLEGPVGELSGMVADFGRIKQCVGKWIDDCWDHNVILNVKDPLMAANNVWVNQTGETSLWAGRHPYTMPCEPTAENMAKELATAVNEMILHGPLAGLGLRVYAVSIRETESCCATYAPEEKPS